MIDSLLNYLSPPAGVYKYQLTQAGTYHYYSGLVLGGFGMAGTIVVSESENYFRYLSLSVGDVEADYATSSGTSRDARAGANNQIGSANRD